MNAALSPTYRNFDLPWSSNFETDRRFRRITLIVLGLTLLLTVLIPMLPVPQIEKPDIEEVPPRMAKLVLERKPPPPEPPPQVIETKPVEVPPTPKPVEPKPQPKPVEPKPTPTPEQQREAARESARNAGLMAYADDLAALRDSPTVSTITEGNAEVTGAPGEGPKTERSIITSKAGHASSGINTAQISRGTGGGGLAGRGTTRVDGPVSSVGGDGGGTGKSAGGAGKGGGASAGGSRSREEIELVFDRNKGALYALYTRALRANPALQGKVVLRLTIQPNGSVSSVEIVSSELKDPDLESKLVARVRLFKFADKDVAPVTTTKPLDFFPS